MKRIAVVVRVPQLVPSGDPGFGRQGLTAAGSHSGGSILSDVLVAHRTAAAASVEVRPDAIRTALALD